MERLELVHTSFQRPYTFLSGYPTVRQNIHPWERFMEHNEIWEKLYGKELPCVRCGETQPVGKLNIEAIHHHGASAPECIDRKSCERVRKKRVRRGVLP